MCVLIDAVVKADGRIAFVGGPSGWGDRRWYLPVARVVELIENPSQDWHFVVEQPVGDRVNVVVRIAGGAKFLSTQPDTAPNAQNNLANLPEPPGDKASWVEQTPQNAAWMPGPKTPIMERFGLQDLKPSASAGNAYRVLPTTSVGFRLLAPWPGDLRFVVRRLMGGSVNLEIDLPSGRRTEPPWVDYTPIDPDFVKRDQTMWGVQVSLPPPTMGAWVEAETYAIEVRHLSINAYCPSPRLSDPLWIGLAARRTGTLTVGSAGGAGNTPSTGTQDVVFSSVGDTRAGYPTAFRADTRQLSNIPAGAVITSATNASRTAPIANGAIRERRPLGGMLFGATDVAGRSRSMIPGTSGSSLGPDQSTSTFNGLEVRGTWDAEYVGGSVAFLFENPGTSGAVLNPEIKLRLSWARS
jgi:hypothetical protein